MAKPKKGGLGKGLEALFADNDTGENIINSLPIDDIEPNREQPRRNFDPVGLAELAGSIKIHGVLQPLVVRPMPNGRYQIVAGERRWRAARMADVVQLPVVIKELNDQQTMEFALVENLLREDLNPMEEALGYKKLIEEFGLTQEQVSQRIGKSRPVVTNALRLLTLPEDIITLLIENKISAGHGRALAVLDAQNALAVVEIILQENLSVRQTEEYVKKHITEKPLPVKIIKPGDYTSYYREIELSLNEYLGRKVRVTANSKGKGKIMLSFHSREELDEFVSLLGNNSLPNEHFEE